MSFLFETSNSCDECSDKSSVVSDAVVHVVHSSGCDSDSVAVIWSNCRSYATFTTKTIFGAAILWAGWNILVSITCTELALAVFGSVCYATLHVQRQQLTRKVCGRSKTSILASRERRRALSAWFKLCDLYRRGNEKFFRFLSSTLDLLGEFTFQAEVVMDCTG